MYVFSSTMMYVLESFLSIIKHCLTISVSLYGVGGGITKDMKDFLKQDFPNTDEVDIDLQDAARDNLYAKTVPCTYFPLAIPFVVSVLRDPPSRTRSDITRVTSGHGWGFT